MPKTIISDTSCLIILSKIGELDLLFRTYGQITTTKEVALEYGEQLPEWIEIVSVKIHRIKNYLNFKSTRESRAQLH
jgi:predicted nucleic acid-binding protein